MDSPDFFSGRVITYDINQANMIGNVNTQIYAHIVSSGTTEVLYDEYPYTIRYIMNMIVFTYFITSVIILVLYIPYPVISGN